MRVATLALALAAGVALLAPATARAGRPRPPSDHEVSGSQLFESPQVGPIAISPDGMWVVVANTTSNSVSVIQRATKAVVKTIPVGVEPVAVAFTPDGSEAWVSNHVSDTVSVIDTDTGSGSWLQVVETVQTLDAQGRTLFDEPTGIAFKEDGSEAYIALSSRNQIAVVDTGTYQVAGLIEVTAQEPRAIAVRNNRLYVVALESGNMSELSICASLFGSQLPGEPCSLGLADIAQFITSPNLPDAVKNITIEPDHFAHAPLPPDRDLFVFDTNTHAQVAAVSHVGTLLYGIAVDAAGRAFVTSAEARNAENGDEGQNLVDLQNRMFLNQIAAVTCSGSSCGAVTRWNLDPALPAQPSAAEALATPYGVAISADGSTLLVTAAGTSRVFTVNVLTGVVQDRLDLGSGASLGQQIPRGVALVSEAGSGDPLQAWVLNSLENTVSVVDVSDPGDIALVGSKIAVGADPTPLAVRRGRIAFHNAFASSSGTFSCASCHPDGNTDQLLWRIGGACFFGNCSGDDEPRSTMPIRGLARTVPLHWDGTLGDPFGGRNGAFATSQPASCNAGDADGEHDCFVDLVDASLSGVMCEQSPACAAGPSGLPGRLSVQQRDDMARFLALVSYPPARSRRIDDSVSKTGQGVMVGAIEVSALQGFADFFMDQGGTGDGSGQGNPSTCADSDGGCHELPLGAATNSFTLAGFEAPTMRGMTDRFLQFSLGPTNADDILQRANNGINLTSLGQPFAASPLELPIRWDPAQGFEEITSFGASFLAFENIYGDVEFNAQNQIIGPGLRPLDIFQMFEEASTGHSGATGRQLTLNSVSAAQPATAALLVKLEAADTRGVVNLIASGLRSGRGVTLSWRGDTGSALWKAGALELSHAQLLTEAQNGITLVTITAHLRSAIGDPQPLLRTLSIGVIGTTGDPPLPLMSTGGSSNPPAFNVRATDVKTTARVFLDGQPASGAILACVDGSSGGFCTAGGRIAIDLPAPRPSEGTHLVQVQNPAGRLSNELALCVGSASICKNP